MEIDLSKHISDEEIKAIVIDEFRASLRTRFGTTSSFATAVARQLSKDGVQEVIPEFKELINAHIQEQISKIKLADMFMESFGWRSAGNKIINQVLSDNKELLDKKIKQILFDK